MQTIIFNSHQEYHESEVFDVANLQWIDISRKADFSREDLPAFLRNKIHEKHLLDLSNSNHPPSCECTDEYELLIFRGVDQRYEVMDQKTCSTVFILLENTLLTVHDENDAILLSLQKKWLAGSHKHPKDLLSLFHALIDVIGNSYLGLSEPMNNCIQQWQSMMLNPAEQFKDWQILLQAKSGLRWLNINLELQRDVLKNWRNETHYEFTQSHLIHFNDFDDHLARIERLTDGIRADLDSLTHVYFATTGQKTNLIVQFLAVISAIFLPLNLIAAIYGMNFSYLPLLDKPWGVFMIIFMMIVMSSSLLLYFKKKHWF